MTLHCLPSGYLALIDMLEQLLSACPNAQETEFVPNMVRTAKYEYYDFLPKFLWEEFNPATKIANVYFLFIAALQASPTYPLEP